MGRVPNTIHGSHLTRARVSPNVAYPLLTCRVASARASPIPRVSREHAPALVATALATFQHLVRDVRRPSTDWDWTAIAYLAAGVAALVCLVNLLR